MGDLKKGEAGYGVGEIDTSGTYSAGEKIVREFFNGMAQAIVQLQQVLGVSTSLRGTKESLVERLSVTVNPNGTMKDFDASTKAVFPGRVVEGMTGKTSFNPNELIRMHAEFDEMQSSGVTVRPTVGGHVVTEDSAQNVRNKVLHNMTIIDWTSLSHTHQSAEEGGVLTSSIGRSQIRTATVTVSGTGGGNVTMQPYAFFPMVHTTVNTHHHSPGGNPVMSGHPSAGSADAPRFAIRNAGTWTVSYRYIRN